MPRIIFYWISVAALALVAGLYWVWPPVLFLLILIVPYIGVGIYDIVSPYNVLGNYPVIGHLRYFFEFIAPELRQYFLETNQSGRPFNREQRTLIYARASGKTDTQPFGTQQDVSDDGYEFTYHAIATKTPDDAIKRIDVGGPGCSQPYNASRLNISAMSFGALSANAIMALNWGAKLGGFAHNTGEGGLSPYHLKYGGDIIWQLGTGYFGCRTQDGGFDADEFRRKALGETVKMIEIKISQGAKPSHGGVLPGAKVNAEIAQARGVPQGQTCVSPPMHREFDSPEGLLRFVVRLRELCDGKPVGFKLCIGKRPEFMGICKAMLKTGITPDFITVDGAEGGTGAAPVEFTDRFGTPINEALVFVHSCLLGIGLRDRIRVIASGKVASGFDIVTKLALGADMCNVARPMMFSVGCIQALRCDRNTCPTGVATQDARRSRALKVEDKRQRPRNLHHAMIESFVDLLGAMGLEHPGQLGPELIYHRVNDGPAQPYSQIYPYLTRGELLGDRIHPAYSDHWAAAHAERF